MNDIYYRIHRKNQTDIIAEYALSNWSDLNNITRGENARFNFHFETVDDLTVSSSYTVASGELEQYDVVTVESGATLTVDGILSCTLLDNDGTVDNNGEIIINDAPVDNLRDYGDFAGGFATVETLTSEIKYNEQIPSDADVNSIAIGIEPATNLQNSDIPGVWGLVNSVTDTRPRALSDNRVEVELTVLAELDEYADHTALENGLQV